MNLLHSKRLVVSSMMYREHFRRLEKRIPPAMIEKLVRVTKVPSALKYRLHPYTGPVSLAKPNTLPL